MAVNGLEINYNNLDECIKSLRDISDGTGGDYIKKKIAQLSKAFNNSSSNTSDALKGRCDYYNVINQELINLSSNAADVLEIAKQLYKNQEEIQKESL